MAENTVDHMPAEENLLYVPDKRRTDGGSLEAFIVFLKEKLPRAAFHITD